MQKGKLFIVSGPSGVGKSTILKELFARRENLYFSVSATTRAPRPGEEDGVHYHFLSAETFRKWVEEDEFLEYAEFVGNAYGTPKRYVDEALERRLTARGTDTPEKIHKRLLRAREEVRTAHTYNYFVINDTVDHAVMELEAILTAEHCRPDERMEIICGE